MWKEVINVQMKVFVWSLLITIIICARTLCTDDTTMVWKAGNHISFFTIRHLASKEGFSIDQFPALKEKRMSYKEQDHIRSGPKAYGLVGSGYGLGWGWEEFMVSYQTLSMCLPHTTPVSTIKINYYQDRDIIEKVIDKHSNCPKSEC